jgi:RNA polymerase sigma-54 factor
MVRLGQSLSLQMKQSPQQVLLSSLLQLPIMSLEQRLATELEMNPLLEMDQDEELDQSQEELSEKDRDEEKKVDEDNVAETEIEKEKDEIDWDEILHDDDNYEFRLPRDKNEEENERVEVHQETLTDHLMTQLHTAGLTPVQELIGEYIVWNINNVGYLDVEVEAIAENIEEDIEAIEEVLDIIQQFDPPGIGARNLQECLLIQLLQEESQNELVVKLVRDQFDDFKNMRFERLAKNLMIDLEAVKRTMDYVKKLNPKPGQGYVSFGNQYVVPDIEVRKEDGEFKISMHDFNIPQLRINNKYRKMMLDKKKTSKDARDYIRQRLESARWLINSIHQRRATILRTVETIIQKQEDFFENGPEHLKPMILKNIADEIGMDISTISRVTNGKYIQTEYGVFELKFFFSEKYTTDDGEDVSNKKIKNIIKGLVEKEPANKPLNDQKISEILKGEGFPVARRTVAKYREQMSIPVARLRRRI